MTEQSEIAKMESEAKHKLQGLKHKKGAVTRNLNLCLTMLEVCKGEIRSTVPLSKKSTEDTMTQYNRAQISLNDLEASMERYITLVTQTYWEEDNGPIDETEEGTQDVLHVLIDKNLESLTDYTNKFIKIRSKSHETF